MAPHISALAAALVRRMQTSQIAGLRSSLILILARLVHMSVPDVNQFINLLLAVPAEGYENAFACIMSEWAKEQVEIQGAFQIKVTTTALALLLSTRHAELSKINVQGQLISHPTTDPQMSILVFQLIVSRFPKSNAGIIILSKAKLVPDQWKIPLPAKILALLADMLIKIQEQIGAGDEQVVDAIIQSERIYRWFMSGFSVCVYSTTKIPILTRISAFGPLNEINMASYLVDFIIQFAQADGPIFDHLSQNLTQPQQKAILMVLNR